MINLCTTNWTLEILSWARHHCNIHTLYGQNPTKIMITSRCSTRQHSGEPSHLIPSTKDFNFHTDMKKFTHEFFSREKYNCKPSICDWSVYFSLLLLRLLLLPPLLCQLLPPHLSFKNCALMREGTTCQVSKNESFAEWHWEIDAIWKVKPI